ncbi:hypothetical protein [Paenibacillus taichungensis]|uniref:hypothetical protein n=1 Tax=Paenibacillus taichungensis TaxID=484184 RepID=UPI0039A738B2
MPEKSGFFDSTSDDIRAYPARDFADYFAQILTNGVFNGGQFLNPTATGLDANVSVSPGYAWINGYVYSIYDGPLSLPIQPATAQARIDRIVIRLDTSTAVRLVRMVVLQGNPATTPTPPPLVRSGTQYDISIAQVLVPANSTIITQANITDERLNNAVCGLVNSLVKVDTTVFQQQWDDFIRDVQQEGFATTQYVDNRVLTGGYGATTNSGNVYSVTLNPAPTALVAGLRATIRINAANTGAATINVNGLGAKAILKSNGSALTANSLRSASVYSLVYNGTSFILQGEGGEYGTAVAGDVRSTKTIGTDSGIVTGALITRNTSETIVVPGETDQVLPSGIYDFPIKVEGRVAKKYATGLITSPATSIQFTSYNDISYGAYPLLVTGLTFRPTVVVVTRQVLGTRDVSTYTFAFNNAAPNASGTTFNYCSILNTTQSNIIEFIKINEYTGAGSNARGYMNDTSFCLPVTTGNVLYRWEAFG